MTGFINLNKAVGSSSAREVSVIKRLTGQPCGHMGTLDPMASGVLPVGIGNACRLFDYFLTKRKTYLATFRFGEHFDTLDTTGQVISAGGHIPEREEIECVLPRLVGEVMQVPPKYSAKSIGGKRGYALARAGVDFELPPKRVSIYSIDLVARRSEDEYDFRIKCGGGTYVRSICRDMAEMLGTFAAMSALIREKSGPFAIENSVAAEQLNSDNILQYIIPADSVLPFDSVHVADRTQFMLLNGMSVPTDLVDGTYKIYLENGQFYGLGAVADCRLKVKTKLC
ncbi:MAG TPA: tRNA pseudouridine(55) synthase TruB [Candidatus Coproplasma excrementipullorum]|nr:tRNA pseudouridine(55) synthase TruB [Candidatus Coproplasma excrementipullorum]